MALEGDVRVGLFEGCCELRVWDKMSQKEKDEALLIESEGNSGIESEGNDGID